MKLIAFISLLLWASAFLIIGLGSYKGQTINFESFTGKPFKVNGGVSANGVFYNSNRDGQTRAPFTYNFNGNLVFSLYSFSIPVSYNFTNAGSKLSYSFPFQFNRLSLSPKYKWVQAHIGDCNMSFSPYTLNGMQFTGGGVELTPDLPVSFSAMYGRIFKAVPDDDNPKTIPSFKRMAYGTKVGINLKKHKIGFIGFYAKDDPNSIPTVPDEKNVTPKENLVVGFTLESQLTNQLRFTGEYTNSALTQDLRAEASDTRKGWVSTMLPNKVSTESFSALKVGLDYKVKNLTLGTSYERIDPDYQTLGAYYFTNDMENITVNASAPLFKNKLNLSTNIGIQKDNLDRSKQSSTQRLVASLNASAQLSEQLMANATFSNFTTTTNVNPDQFQAINQENPEIADVEELNFRQLSKNATLSLNYNFKKQENAKKNLNFNYAFNQVVNEQGGIIRPDQLSAFHNFATAYNMNFVASGWRLSASFNYTLNTIARENSHTFGPIATVGKKLFNDQVNTQFVASYNQSSGTMNSSVTNLRFTSSYVYKERHNFNLSATQAFKSSDNSPSLNELTVSFGYNYNFNVGKVRLNRTPRVRTPREKNPKEKKDRKKKTKKEKEPEIDNTDILYKALAKLKKDATKYSEQFDKVYFKVKYGQDVESVIFSKDNSTGFFSKEYQRLIDTGKDFTKQEKLYISHYKMLEELNTINSKEDMMNNESLKAFMKLYLNKPLEGSDKEIDQLEVEMANYFFNQYFPLK